MVKYVGLFLKPCKNLKLYGVGNSRKDLLKKLKWTQAFNLVAWGYGGPLIGFCWGPF